MLLYLRKRIIFAIVAATISDVYFKFRAVQMEKHLRGVVTYAIVSGIIAITITIIAHVALFLLQKELADPMYKKWRFGVIIYQIIFAIGSIGHVALMF